MPVALPTLSDVVRVVHYRSAIRRLHGFVDNSLILREIKS